jgi:hypothetical protein
MIAGCDFDKDKIPLYQYSPLSSAIYYPSTTQFSAYDGIDLLPENKANYVYGGDFARKLQYPSKKSSRHRDTIMMHTCKLPDKDSDGGRVIQRVGPFTSTGGYDWWQIGWTNVGLFKDILASHPNGIDIINYIIVPVSENGNRIGHPPIHVHHVHIIPQPGVRTRNIMRAICISSSGIPSDILDKLLIEKNCYNSSLFFEQHGDYQCKDEDGGLDCLLGGDHNHRRISQALDIEGEVNDVRPANSSALIWYFQVAFEWKAVDPELKKPPVSQMTISAPAATTTLFDGDQLKRTLTFPTPTFAEHMIWYQGQMWADGELVRNKLHVHSLIFESSVFFVGTPVDLGLDSLKFSSRSAYKPMQTTALGFENNRELARYILERLHQSQELYDQSCVSSSNRPLTMEYHELYNKIASDEQDASNSKQLRCSRPRPRFLCGGVYDLEFFDFGDPSASYGFDRRPKTYCEAWQFKKGESFVVVGLTKKLTHPVTPSNPNHVPEFIPGHISWHLWYHRPGYGHSAFARIVCNQQGIFYSTDERYNPVDVLAIMTTVTIYGGIPPDMTIALVVKYSYVAMIYLLMLVIAWSTYIYCYRKATANEKEISVVFAVDKDGKIEMIQLPVDREANIIVV